jgi:hypothetical protein
MRRAGPRDVADVPAVLDEVAGWLDERVALTPA